MPSAQSKSTKLRSFVLPGIVGKSRGGEFGVMHSSREQLVDAIRGRYGVRRARVEEQVTVFEKLVSTKTVGQSKGEPNAV